MKSLLPWRDEGVGDFERALLDAGAGERPHADSRRRVVAILAAATATAAMPGAASGAAPVTLAVVKWIGAGLVAGIATVSVGYGLVVAVTPSPAPALSVRAPSPAISRQVSVVTRPRVLPSTGSMRPIAEPPPVEISAATSAPEPDPLEVELALLDSTQRALQRGDHGAAAQRLAEHARLPRRQLGPEAEILAIELALAQGDRGGAESLARAFLAAHPRSPHARRVASLLARASEDSPIDSDRAGNGTD